MKHFLVVGLLCGNWLSAGCVPPFIDILVGHFSCTVMGNFPTVNALLTEGRAFPLPATTSRWC